MHNKDKYPEIWAVKEKAEAALRPLLAERKVQTDEMKSVQLQMSELRQQLYDLNTEAMKDVAAIVEHRDTISRMARAMGAVTASGG